MLFRSGVEPQLDYTIQTNWGLKAKVSVLPAKPEDATRTEVFTDGSKLNKKVGYGYTIQQNGKEITSGKMGLPPHASVYQAELHPIQKAVERLEELSIRGPVTVHTDSLSSIFALQAQEVVSLQCGEIDQDHKPLRQTQRSPHSLDQSPRWQSWE